MGLLKIVLFIFNVCFWLLGATMTGFGIWMILDPEFFGFSSVTDNTFWIISLYIIISVGALVFVVGFLGCLGACIDSKCLLISYSVVTMLAIVLELVAITFASIFFVNMDPELREAMYYDVRNRYVNEYSSDTLSQAWNRMQIEWQCCGSNDYTDYRGSRFQLDSLTRAKVPWTCCVLRDGATYPASPLDVQDYDACQRQALLPVIDDIDDIDDDNLYDRLHSRGCYYEMEDTLNTVIPITLLVLSVAAGMQLIGFTIAIIMCNKEDSRVEAFDKRSRRSSKSSR